MSASEIADRYLWWQQSRHTVVLHIGGSGEGLELFGQTSKHSGHASTLRRDRCSDGKITVLITERIQSEERLICDSLLQSCIITLYIIPSVCTGLLLPRFGLPGSAGGCQVENRTSTID